MHAFKLATTALLAWTASAAVHEPLVNPGIWSRDDLALMKRQNISVGSPLYNCHDNCGEAILEVQNCGSGSTNICNDTTFTTDYANCLQCSGSDNDDIWKYYGGSLNTTAASCGLSTTPASGTQDGVGTAITASNSTSACEAAVASSTASSTSTSSSSSASSTSSSTSDAGKISIARLEGYAAVAFGALFIFGL